MNILTCLKQVPEKDSRYKIDSSGIGVSDENLTFETNESDLYALEEGLRLKERVGGEVLALSLGPERVDKVLRNALAMGADSALHVKDESYDGGDAWVTAQTIVAAIRQKEFDLILTGVQSEDMGHGQTGTMIAQLLGWSHATIVTSVDVIDECSRLQVERELGNNVFERIELQLPAVLTIQSGINQIRYITLKGIMQAKNKPYKIISTDDLDLQSGMIGEESSKLKPQELLVPQKKRQTVMIEGDAEVAVKSLMDRLQKEAKIL